MMQNTSKTENTSKSQNTAKTQNTFKTWRYQGDVKEAICCPSRHCHNGNPKLFYGFNVSN